MTTNTDIRCTGPCGGETDCDCQHDYICDALDMDDAEAYSNAYYARKRLAYYLANKVRLRDQGETVQALAEVGEFAHSRTHLGRRVFRAYELALAKFGEPAEWVEQREKNRLWELANPASTNTDIPF